MLSALRYHLFPWAIRQPKPFGNLVEHHREALTVLVHEAEDLVILPHLRTTQEETGADCRFVTLGQLRIPCRDNIRGCLCSRLRLCLRCYARLVAMGVTVAAAV